MMVVDLQGIVSHGIDGEPEIVLTDPAIHCYDRTRFGRTNLGIDGMRQFFRSHVCNEFCRGLGLKAVAVAKLSNPTTTKEGESTLARSYSRLTDITIHE